MMKDLIKVVSSPLVVTYCYLGLYIALSCGVILYNKVCIIFFRTVLSILIKRNDYIEE